MASFNFKYYFIYMSEAENNKYHLSDPSEWVDSHGDYLYRYTLLRLNNKTVAEDIVQETFLSALKARNNFQGRATEKTWLIGILKRKIIDHVRKVSREADLPDDDFNLSDADPDYHGAGIEANSWIADRRPKEWMIDKNDLAEQSEFWEYLHFCLTELKPRLAICFVLREMEEIDSEKICNIMKFSATNLRVILHRVRADLRRCLELNWIEGGGTK